MLTRGLYKCPNHSVYLRVLNIYFTNETYTKVKLRFEYKSGMIIEQGQYKLELKNIQHWIKVCSI